jgi:hypothetical protein
MIFISSMICITGLTILPEKFLLYLRPITAAILLTVISFVVALIVFVVFLGNSGSYGVSTAFADHGKEILVELNSGTFMPLTTAAGNQVKVGLNFTTLESTLIGNTINAVMKVYAPNTTAIKSTSFPHGFVANSSGTLEIKTTITNSSMQNVTAVVQFTDVTKTVPLSNPIQIGLNLTQSAASTAASLEPEYEIAALPPS